MRVLPIIEQVLPTGRRARLAIRVLVATTIVTVWALVWWPGAIAAAGLAVLVEVA